MSVSFTGKILFFKNLSISSTETFTGFKRVPSDLTFAQALELLKKEESSVAADKESCRDGACPVSPAPPWRRSRRHVDGNTMSLITSPRVTFLRAR